MRRKKIKGKNEAFLSAKNERKNEEKKSTFSASKNEGEKRHIMKSLGDGLKWSVINTYVRDFSTYLFIKDEISTGTNE